MSAEILVKKMTYPDGLADGIEVITGTGLLATESPDRRTKQLGLADLWKIQQGKRYVSVYPRRV